MQLFCTEDAGSEYSEYSKYSCVSALFSANNTVELIVEY